MIATEPIAPEASGRDRAAQRRDLRGPAPPRHLRTAHSGRPHRLRGTGRPLPLRLAHKAGVRLRPADPRPAFTRLSSSCSRHWRGVRVTHRWGGPLGIARDWHPSVGYDRATGLGWAGGYVGDGVAVTNLAGRTLAALITGVEDDCTQLCWVGHRSPLGARASALDRGQLRPTCYGHRPTEAKSAPGRTPASPGRSAA